MLPKYNPVDDVPAPSLAVPPVGRNTTSSAQPEAMYAEFTYSINLLFSPDNQAEED